MGRGGGDRHRGGRQLAALDERVDGVLAQQAGEDGVAHPRVVEVVAAQVGDAGDHPGLHQREPRQVGRDGHRRGDEAADVGHEALGAGVADVVLDDLVDGALGVAVLLGQLLVGRVRGARQGADPLDRAVQRLAHDGAGHARRHIGDPGCQPLADGVADAHGQILCSRG